MKPLALSFYQDTDVVAIAKKLLGKGLFTRFGNETGGLIIETEAYAGINDRASHAYAGRRTPRTEIMYGPGGRAYVYFCYGMHYLLNAVTAPLNTPHAVLIRAILPTIGIQTMLERRGKKKLDKTLCNGPGALCQALGITKEHNGLVLDRFPLLIGDMGDQVREDQIHALPRVGVDYAGPDASLPYRFVLDLQLIAK
jgi:DNA-3-methyladenine glycosylase